MTASNEYPVIAARSRRETPDCIIRIFADMRFDSVSVGAFAFTCTIHWYFYRILVLIATEILMFFVVGVYFGYETKVPKSIRHAERNGNWIPPC